MLVSDQPFTSNSLSAALGNGNVSAFSVAGEAGLDEVIALGVSGRYVRVQLAGADYLQLAEVEVYGVPL